MSDCAGHIDFDQWAALAASDPEAFETRRAQLIDATIRRAPAGKQQRLRCLQWKVDQVRRLSRTPLAACVRMSNMMWESVLNEGGLLEALEGRAQSAPTGRPKARLLAFPRERQDLS